MKKFIYYLLNYYLNTDKHKQNQHLALIIHQQMFSSDRLAYYQIEFELFDLYSKYKIC